MILANTLFPVNKRDNFVGKSYTLSCGHCEVCPHDGNETVPNSRCEIRTKDAEAREAVFSARTAGLAFKARMKAMRER